MENTFTRVEELIGSVKEYVNTRIEAAKLNVASRVSRLLANAAARLMAAVMIFFFLLFAGIGLSILLGMWIGKIWAGFLVVAVLYLLLGWIAWVARQKLIRLPVMNAILQQFSASHEEDL